MSEEPGLGASVSSVGDFSRIAGESLSLSRVDPGSSMVMRNHNGSMKDPLSMVSVYSHKQFKPTKGISVTILEEDEDEPDFQRDPDGSFRRSANGGSFRKSPTWSGQSHTTAGVQSGYGSIQQYRNTINGQKVGRGRSPGSQLDESQAAVDTSQVQLIQTDYVSDQPIEMAKIDSTGKDFRMQIEELHSKHGQSPSKLSGLMAKSLNERFEKAKQEAEISSNNQIVANQATELPPNTTAEEQEKPTKKLAGILSKFWGGGLAKKTNTGGDIANDQSKIV